MSTKASINGLPIAAISSVPIVGPIAGLIAIPILKEFVDVVFEQTSSIDQKLDKLIKVHYEVGIESLRDAANVDDRMRDSRILKALDEFTDASKLECEVVRLAQSMFYVGVCYTLLGQPGAALRWYEKAYQKGQEHLKVLRQRVEDERAGYGKAVSVEARAGALDDLVSWVTDLPASGAIVNQLAKGALKAGPYGSILALAVVGVGYTTVGVVKGGKAVAGMIGASRAKNLSKGEQELVFFTDQFLMPLKQLLPPE